MAIENTVSVDFYLPSPIGFEPHRCHCVVVLEQDTFILA